MDNIESTSKTGDVQPSLLIRGAAAILTGGSGTTSLSQGHDIRIRNGIIAAIGDLPPEPGERVLDASGCVVYPAWVNTHHHLAQSLLKGVPGGINSTLTPWLSAVPFRFRKCFDEQLLRTAARIGLIELALSGCGTVADHHYMYWRGMDFDGARILFEEAARLGMRFVLCRGGATHSRDFEQNSREVERLSDYLDDVSRLQGEFHEPGPNAMRRVVVAPTTVMFSMDSGELREVAEHARSLGLRLHSHLSETVLYQEASREKYHCTPVQLMEKTGWLGPDVWFAHLVKLDRAEIELLGVTHTGIAHCPQSNGRLASGIAPIRALQDAGVQISLAVDGAGSNEAADMLHEAHVAWLMGRARAGQGATPRYAGGRGEEGADSVTVEDVIHWGTAGGATVLGLHDVGTVAPGKAADIAIYELDQPRHFGVHDLSIAPVICGGATVKALLVAGRVVVENGKIPRIDLSELRFEAQHAVTLLQKRAAV
jgi:8-oxoguanine deaminase